MEKWYVVRTKAREEARAAFFLRGKGVETYFPRMEFCVMTGAKGNMVLKPLFPNYIFARFDREKHLFKVSWTKGVQKILPESGNPAPLDEAIIQAIKILANGDAVVRKGNFKKRDRIRVIRGPMKDIVGIFENWASDQGRVRILLDLFNYQARLELHHSLIERVG